MLPIHSKSPSLALLTDFYQLTMAYASWKTGRTEAEGVFHLTFRQNPFAGGYAVLCGVADAVEYLENYRFNKSDLDYLATLKRKSGEPLFEDGFLRYLGDLKLTCDIDAPAEGTVVFPHQPLLRVRGPLLQGQLLETPLLNIINFQTLIATKAARITQAAGLDPVMEFGLRRAQGMDGAISATRAAYVGGVSSTSNVLAAKLFNIPVQGTHAHSWIMSFPDETEAFRSFARAMPGDSVFLVDTFNTLEGVRRASKIALELRAQGHELLAIRLDSGDLAYLSQESRRLLDSHGLQNVKIIATNDLDETVIESLKQQGARVDIWGVGTRLVTGYDQPALGAVYKLGAFRASSKDFWQYKVKLSEQTAKISSPGILQTRRFFTPNGFVGDAVYDTLTGISDQPVILDPLDLTKRKAFAAGTASQDLLQPLFQNGRRVYQGEPLQAARDRARTQLAQLHAGVRRFKNPHIYPVGLEETLYRLRVELILAARQQNQHQLGEDPHEAR